MCQSGVFRLPLQLIWRRLLTAANKHDDKAYYIALGGMVAALSLIFMFLSAVFPAADLVFPALAGVLLICTLYEMGTGWSFLIFAVVGILSLLMLPTKEVALYYIFFLGHYPIIKSYIERISNKPLKWVVKIAVVNVCAAAVLLVSVWLFDFSSEIFEYGYALLALLLNAAFVVYDIALDRLAVLYRNRIQKIIRRR